MHGRIGAAQQRRPHMWESEKSTFRADHTLCRPRLCVGLRFSSSSPTEKRARRSIRELGSRPLFYPCSSTSSIFRRVARLDDAATTDGAGRHAPRCQNTIEGRARRSIRGAGRGARGARWSASVPPPSRSARALPAVHAQRGFSTRRGRASIRSRRVRWKSFARPLATRMPVPPRGAGAPSRWRCSRSRAI